MPYIGQFPTTGRFIICDDISSQFDGSAVTFILRSGGTPISAGTTANCQVSLDRLLQRPNLDYSTNGDLLTFVVAPASGTLFSALILGDIQQVGTPSDGTVTPASISQTAGANFTFPIVTTDELNVGNINASGVHEFDGNITITGTVTAPNANITNSGFVSHLTFDDATGGALNVTTQANISLLTVTGSISGSTARLTQDIIAASGLFTTLVSGVTVTGTFGEFGTSVTTTSGVFTNTTTTSGHADEFSITTGVVNDLTVNTTLTSLGTTIFAGDVTTTGAISGTTVTAPTGVFTDLTATNSSLGSISGVTITLTQPSGSTAALSVSGVIEGGSSGVVIKGPITVLP